MTTTQQRRERGHELTELAVCREIEGLRVEARWFFRPGRQRERYELVVEGGGEVAVADFRDIDVATRRTSEAMVLFAASVRQRRPRFGPLPARPVLAGTPDIR